MTGVSILASFPTQRTESISRLTIVGIHIEVDNRIVSWRNCKSIGFRRDQLFTERYFVAVFGPETERPTVRIRQGDTSSKDYSTDQCGLERDDKFSYGNGKFSTSRRYLIVLDSEKCCAKPYPQCRVS